MYRKLIFTFSLVCMLTTVRCAELDGGKDWFKIEGKVQAPDTWARSYPEWKTQTSILVDGGEYRAFLKDDGSFSVNVPSGSFVVEIFNPAVYYEPVRVDINSKGKIRARKVNHVQPSAVSQVTYPLKFKPGMPYRYFQQREQWRLTDLLFSPMVLMMLVPVIFAFIIPKLMSDPETRKEMESMQLPKYDMPEMSEMLTNFFGSGETKKAVKPKASTKRKP